MTILNIIYVIAAVLAAFGASIFLHELGHFWVARKLGMKVEEFAIGFGPKIYSRTREGIEYSLRWIPAGGFVKLPQMITAEALEGHADEQIPPAPPLHKILVAVAGPFMNVVFAFAIATLIYFVGLPVPDSQPIIGKVAGWVFAKTTGWSWWTTSPSSRGKMSWSSRCLPAQI
jgi:regulator of sigma E protease